MIDISKVLVVIPWYIKVVGSLIQCIIIVAQSQTFINVAIISIAVFFWKTVYEYTINVYLVPPGKHPWALTIHW